MVRQIKRPSNGLKFLFDQNLSHRLPRWLANLYPDSQHVRATGLERATDIQIWEYAKREGFCIVTQDADFAERSRLYGGPPKVLWLRCGNTTPREIEGLLRRNTGLLAALANDPAIHYLGLFA